MPTDACYLPMISLLTFLSIFCTACGLTVFEFSDNSDLSGWQVVNDGVMGGLSKGDLTIDELGNGVFSGFVTLENNGGFSSIRLRTDETKLENCSQVILHVKGDGKRYQFRIKSSSRDRVSYIHYFQTSEDWEEIVIPLAECIPSFRGMQLDMPNFPMETFGELGVLIANKKNEKFRLEISSISMK